MPAFGSILKAERAKLHGDKVSINVFNKFLDSIIIMKSVISIVSIFSLLICFSCQNKEVTIYVDVNGEDTASGSKISPVKTIEKARDIIAALDKGTTANVILEDGTYYFQPMVSFCSIVLTIRIRVDQDFRSVM